MIINFFSEFQNLYGRFREDQNILDSQIIINFLGFRNEYFCSENNLRTNRKTLLGRKRLEVRKIRSNLELEKTWGTTDDAEKARRARTVEHDDGLKHRVSGLCADRKLKMLHFCSHHATRPLDPCNENPERGFT